MKNQYIRTETAFGSIISFSTKFEFFAFGELKLRYQENDLIMAHREYNSRDGQSEGLGLGGGDADNSVRMRRPTPPPLAVQHERAGTMVVELAVDTSRSMRPANQQQPADRDQLGISPEENCQGSELVVASSHPSNQIQDHRRPNQMVRFCLRVAYNALLYPYEMAKVLIQLGHEPLQAKPFLMRLFQRRPRLFLPSVHEYVQHIQNRDGYTGMYRGLTARLAASIVDYLLGDLLLTALHFAPYKRGPEEGLSFKEFLWNLTRNSLRLATVVVITHPFYVVMVRQIAQFVGREHVYEGLVGSLMIVAQREGCAGLFAGMVPRLLGEWSVLFITSALSHLCRRLLPMSDLQHQYNTVVIQMMASLVAYPLEVTCACMAGTGAPLTACEPPSMPLYNHWVDCLADLYARGGQNRGAYLFWRTVPRIQLLRNKEIYTIRSS
ncbi:mitochondrial carrier homolog 2 [Drosophila mauritiana]|uniref:Mitochondrial carrier homolog 2 n=1 Tax=Drosophila mauritiana TaxID=7226 RepID=A0A6P8L213_DROMA|nr:mitochondrial carrier homolog 2 [Drosophila mauritiana]